LFLEKHNKLKYFIIFVNKTIKANLSLMRTSFTKLLAIAAISLGSYSTLWAQVLDKQKILNQFDFWGNQDWDWYKENIPFFESPDRDIDMTYYYRWDLMSARLVYGSPTTGYAVTEFVDRPWWSGPYGTISCAAGHQLYELKWMRNPRYFEDFARYWFETPGAQPRNYTTWIADAVWQGYQVYRNQGFVKHMRGHLIKDYQGWEKDHWVEEEGMFAWDGMHDGMETNINSRQTPQWFDGAPGYRPTLNSYMWANANAIRNIALLEADQATAKLYQAKADLIKKNFQEKNWDPKREFFFHRFQKDEEGGIKANTLTYETGKYAGSPHGRELHAFVPWYFGMPDPGYEVAFKFLIDTNYFAAPFGPTTVEKGDPLFNIAKNCCAWSGNAWPFATTQTLKAMANVIRQYEQKVIDKNDYFHVLKGYALTHRKDGQPYIAEANHPETGSWDGHDVPGHSEHYFHSAYVDEIITGLVGLQASASDSIFIQPLIPDHWDYFALDEVFYHGQMISILWDAKGTRYGKGKGLHLLSEGKLIATRPDLGALKAALPMKNTIVKALPVNYAVNNEKGMAFPHVQASHPGLGMNTLDKLNDGQFWYEVRTPNQWSGAYTKGELWAGIDFGQLRPIETIKIYFVEDARSTAPIHYEIDYWENGKWHSYQPTSINPSNPTTNRSNTIEVPQKLVSGIRVRMKASTGKTVTLSELEAWGPRQDNHPTTAPIWSVRTNVALTEGATFEASYTSQWDQIKAIFDGSLLPATRWTTFDSPNASDWVKVDWKNVREVSQARLYFYDDKGGIQLPPQYHLEYWDGKSWKKVDVLDQLPQTAIQGLNIVHFKPVKTQQMRLVVTHKGNKAFTGLYEFEVHLSEKK
jgi:hypothetical protein